MKNSTETDNPASLRLPDGINVVGFPFKISGIGEDLRNFVRALETTAIPFTVISVNTSFGSQLPDPVMENYIDDKKRYNLSVFLMTGFETLSAFLQLGPEFLGKSYNVGYWPWEFKKWPLGWNFILSFMDEFWAISNFVKKCYENATRKPVFHMPPVIVTPPEENYDRKHFGLPMEDFVFLSVFDFQSFIERKNPVACVRAFKAAFLNPEERVRMVVKVVNENVQAKSWRQFEEVAKSDPRIRIVSSVLSRPELSGLIRLCDCFVSLHRCEGLGRSIAEAMLVGKPVISTNFSGSMDLVDENTGYPVGYSEARVPEGAYPYSEGLTWAAPDEKDAARQMRRVYQNRAESSHIAEAGRSLVMRDHSPQVCGERYLKRTREIWKTLQEERF